MPNEIGLYLHIPFCAAKCAYCDFYSISGCEEKERYIDSLMLQIEDYSESAKEHTVDTVFIGGGTPTVISPKSMLDLLACIENNFDITDNAEITMEANPATVNLSTLKKYRKAGINRLSFGLQSANNNELSALSRIHTFEEFVDSYELARRAGFTNINVDIMYGIPEQTPESLRHTLEMVCNLTPDAPEHISLYNLRIEDGTPFSKIRENLASKLPDEDTEYGMYEDSISYLRMRGYEQYEISNFAKPGYECKHNLKYWNCGEYLGLGPGAHSYYNGVRFSFKKDLALYMETLEKQTPDLESILTDEMYTISPSERVGEYIMLQLRLNSGLDVEDFRSRFNLDFEEIYSKYLKLYTQNGFMKKENNRYSFTNKGRYVSNYILAAMLDFKSEIVAGISNGSDK